MKQNLKDLSIQELMAIALTMNDVIKSLLSCRMSFAIVFDKDTKEQIEKFSEFHKSAFELAEIVKLEVENHKEYEKLKSKIPKFDNLNDINDFLSNL